MPPTRYHRLLPGDLVEVRPWPEIAATLGEEGALDGLPFMTEMLPYCGRRFRVRTRVERACEEATGTMRRMRDAVFLENLRCDGSAHGGCAKGCAIFWKEAWLGRISNSSDAEIPLSSGDVLTIYSDTESSSAVYRCQSTELVNATTALPVLDPRAYWRDLRATNYAFRRMIRLVGVAAAFRLRELATGQSHKVLQGRCEKTPVEVLYLQPGEWVQVKSKGEILSTLDRAGKNRGLAFTTEMAPFCGRTFRVLRRLERIIDDSTRRIVELKNTVILDGVTCDGCSHLRGGCPRENYHFWREIWLRRLR